MDYYSPKLLDLGLKCMIGKGERDESVCEAICRNEAVYLCAVGGAGALASACITSCEQELAHLYKSRDGINRCIYCDSEMK
jgi:fumarate hydratase subunit beta